MIGPVVMLRTACVSGSGARNHYPARPGPGFHRWQANSTTLDSGARITVSSVLVSGGKVIPGNWETSQQEYEPLRHYADFVVVQDGETDPCALLETAEREFRHPQRTYRAGRYTVLTWRANLLSYLDHQAEAAG
jgi:hypothetical protein